MSEIKAKPVTGSRPKMVTITIQADGQTLHTAPAILRTFSSGKSGYGTYGKTMLPNGEQLQMSVNLVIPHSEA
jgi:hypothetical protein